MKKIKVNFIERKSNYFVSVEKVFRQVEKGLDKERFEISFQQLPYLNTFFGMIKNLIFFRSERNADVYHITGDCHYAALVLPPRKTVLTIHDLRFLRTRTGMRRWILKKILLDLPLKRLRYVTAISAATKDEILRNSHCEPGKIRVIENPLDDFFISGEKREFNSANPNILQIGTTPHKNVANVIRAIEGVSCRLTLIGDLDDETRNLLLEKSIRFEVKSELDDEAIKGEYEKADLAVFCSVYEGFGLPIIEAQATQTPLVTSNISPLREVAGDCGALIVDPFDHKSIREGILKIIGEPDLRDSLRRKGLKNIQRFQRKEIASKYAQLYDEIASQK